MSRYYRHLIEDGLLLDIYPNASAAYSLRKLRSGYTGPLVNIRRTSDSINQDFYPLPNGELDWDDIGNFVGWNLFAWSEELQQAYWTKTNLTVTTDTLVAPDGNTTGDILYETTTNGTHVIQRTLAVTSGSEYTVSFWIKGEGRNNVRILTSSNLSYDGTAPVAWLDLSTGTIVSQNSGFGGTVQITPDGSWYKVNYTLPAISTATSTVIQLNLSPDGSNISYVGNTSLGIAVWGLQVSETSNIKPYFQTGSLSGGEGRLRIWYSQGLSSRDATASGVATTQSILTVRGKPYLNPNNNKPALQLVTQTRASLSASISIASPHFMIGAYNRRTSSQITLFGNSSVGGSPRIVTHIGPAGSRVIEYRFTNSGVDILSIPYENLESMITTATRNGNNMQVYVNNILIGQRNTALSGTSANITALFQPNSAGNAVGGDIHEMIFWNQDYTALRADITNKINEYYGIY